MKLMLTEIQTSDAFILENKCGQIFNTTATVALFSLPYVYVNTQHYHLPKLLLS